MVSFWDGLFSVAMLVSGEGRGIHSYSNPKSPIRSGGVWILKNESYWFFHDRILIISIMVYEIIPKDCVGFQPQPTP